MAIPAANMTAPAVIVPALIPANTASPPAAPAPSAAAAPAISVSVAAAPVSLGAAVSAAMAAPANPGKNTILKAKTTKVTSAVFQFVNSFIADAPFIKIKTECSCNSYTTPTGCSGNVSGCLLQQGHYILCMKKINPYSAQVFPARLSRLRQA
jgi:hypothetical protein